MQRGLGLSRPIPGSIANLKIVKQHLSFKTGSTQQGADQGSSRILHILLFEDHDDTRRAMELFLEALGHRAHAAIGVQQLDLAAKSHIKVDLLVSDVGLPDGNGWDLLRRLERMGRRPTQAIAISAWGGETLVAESERAGFLMHIVKPISPEVLEVALLQAAKVVYAKKNQLNRSSTPQKCKCLVN
jgi:CheY-like chemotaxis protein